MPFDGEGRAHKPRSAGGPVSRSEPPEETSPVDPLNLASQPLSDFKIIREYSCVLLSPLICVD